jgi:16S rRNA (adenine1518-N6/adenine1519-N6)-dimethyltransferase
MNTVAERAPDVADRLEVVEQDALHLETVPGPAPTAFVANLPYNVAVPVLLRLLEKLPSLQRGLVMVQAEVADRLAAGPGSKLYGVPSVKAAWYADVAKAGAVGRNVFWPAPNVDSGLVSFTRREPPAGDRAATFACIDAAFAQRRKTLRAALAGWAGSAPLAEERLRAAGIDPSARGETLSVEEFARLASP